jgi:hypothetical protein
VRAEAAHKGVALTIAVLLGVLVVTGLGIWQHPAPRPALPAPVTRFVLQCRQLALGTGEHANATDAVAAATATTTALNVQQQPLLADARRLQVEFAGCGVLTQCSALLASTREASLLKGLAALHQSRADPGTRLGQIQTLEQLATGLPDVEGRLRQLRVDVGVLAENLARVQGALDSGNTVELISLLPVLTDAGQLHLISALDSTALQLQQAHVGFWGF